MVGYRPMLCLFVHGRNAYPVFSANVVLFILVSYMIRLSHKRDDLFMLLALLEKIFDYSVGARDSILLGEAKRVSESLQRPRVQKALL